MSLLSKIEDQILFKLMPNVPFRMKTKQLSFALIRGMRATVDYRF